MFTYMFPNVMILYSRGQWYLRFYIFSVVLIPGNYSAPHGMSSYSTIHQNYYKPKSQLKLIILLFRLNWQDVIILIIKERSHLYAAKPGCIIRWHAVVMEEIPLSLVLTDTVVSGPTYYWLQVTPL